MASIAALSVSCNEFSAVLYSSPRVNAHDVANYSAVAHGFVLHETLNKFVTLLGPSSPSVRSEVALAIGLTAKDLTPLPLGVEKRDTYLVSWAAVKEASSSSSSVNSNLPTDLSLVCAMDYFADNGICTFPVPSSANYVDLEVVQSLFQPEGNVITVSFNTRMGSRSVQCGGSLGFSGYSSDNNLCSYSLGCGSGFLYELDSDMLSNPVDNISISVPSSLVSNNPCDLPFVALIDFGAYDDPQVVSGSDGCEFACFSERSCIALNRVCNSVIDCLSGEDESGCYNWFVVEEGYVLNSSTTELVSSPVNDEQACRRLALSRGSSLFAINSTTCRVYKPEDAAAFIAAAPLDQLVQQSGFRLVAQLPKGQASYGRCTKELTCSGNGELIIGAPTTRGKQSCSCECYSGYSGASCSTRYTLASQGPMALQLRGDTNLSASDIEDFFASAVEEKTLITTCSDLERSGTSVVCLCCLSGLEGVVLQVQTIVESDPSFLVQLLNWALPSPDVMSLSLSTIPFYKSAGICNSANSSSTMCAPSTAAHAPIQRIAMYQYASSALSEMRVTVSVQDRPNRNGGVLLYSFASFGCNESSLTHSARGNCIVSACSVPIADLPIASLNVTTTTAVDVIDPHSDPCYSPLVVNVLPSLGSPSLAPAIIENKRGDFSAFAGSGAAVLTIGVAFMIIGVVFGCIDYASVGKPLSTRENDTSLLSLLKDLFHRMGYYTEDRTFRRERWSVGLLVIAFNLLLAGVFLVLVYATSSSFSSNAMVVFEQYRDRNCAQSAFSSSPVRVAYVEAASSHSCKQREVVGSSSDGALFVMGYCSSGDSLTTAIVKLGSSESSCDNSPKQLLPSGKCVEFAPNQFATFTCASTQSALSRFGFFKNLSSLVEADAVLASKTPAEYQQPRLDSKPNRGGVFLHPRVQASSVENASSHYASSFDSIAAAGVTYDIGAWSNSRLLIQHPGEVFAQQGYPYYYPSTDALEVQESLDSLSPDALALGPRSGDYAVGFVYNGFNTTFQRAGSLAGAAAARYYGVANTFADVGKYFGPTQASVDGDGFTVSLYIRATLDTFGFAFAVADARENTKAMTSPLLDKLMTIVGNGSPDSDWYSATYSVYSSLFVDGPAKTLRFLYANAPFDENGQQATSAAGDQRIVRLQWDVEALGLMRLFNGLWHQVHVILRSENALTKAQLIVDGETSLSKPGWNQCVPRRPLPMRTLSATNVRVADSFSERVLKDGVLFSGYLNGGVAQIQFFLQFGKKSTLCGFKAHQQRLRSTLSTAHVPLL